VKVANPSSQDRTPRPAIVFAVPPAAASYRASGLVLWHFSDNQRCRLESAKRPKADMDQRGIGRLAASHQAKSSIKSMVDARHFQWLGGKRRDGLGPRGVATGLRANGSFLARSMKAKDQPPDDMLPGVQGYSATVLLRPRVLRLAEPMIPMHRQGGAIGNGSSAGTE
jgi:hypothetical protein